MKSAIVKALFFCGVLTVPATALTLYDTAPAVGLPESYAVRYGVYMNAGYDDNLNNSKDNREGGGFVRYGVTASYADNEAVTKKSYDVRLGGQLYNKTANGTDQRNFSDISVNARLSHAFSSSSQYAGSFVLRYSPEPDYANGISSAHTQGDCLNWNLSNSYSQTIDCRWSWTANFGYSGNVYTDSDYEVDDRTYVTGGLSLNFRHSARTTYSFSATWRDEMRSEGYDSDSIYTTFSVNHAISPVASVSLTAGAQVKMIDGENNIYPNLRLGYNRQLTKGLSMRAYLSLDNENVDTYNRYSRSNYLSDMTWRVGLDCSYVFTPRVSFSFGTSLLDASYSDGTRGAQDTGRTTWTAFAGMNYKFTEQLSGNLRYNYTYSDSESNFGTDDYYRNVVSAGLSYSF
ncbi:MAG: outer membrane beta-barrel protein [Akkermansia sp.]|nr:outer membrane beta-barrel protein [Akkermansia sp.]